MCSILLPETNSQQLTLSERVTDDLFEVLELSPATKPLILQGRTHDRRYTNWLLVAHLRLSGVPPSERLPALKRWMDEP